MPHLSKKILPLQSLLNKIKTTHKNIPVLLFTALILCVSFHLLREMPTLADEATHFRQIKLIYTGENKLPSECAYLPGYHWSVAVLSDLADFGRSYAGITMFRTWTTVLSLLCILAFLLLAEKIDKDSASQKTFLFLVSPFFFPFFCLLYTDMYALFFILLAVLFALNQRFWLAGITGIIGLFVRQNNIIWLGLAGLAGYLESARTLPPWKDLRRLSVSFFFFILAAVLLTAFVIWNDGLVLGDKKNHYLTFSMDNVFFLLFMFFFLFLPLNLSNAGKILTLLRRKKILWFALGGLFLIYFYFFEVASPYNRFDFFLHHYVLYIMFLPFIASKVLTFLPIAYSVLSLCVTPLKRKSFYLLYPFTFIFLTPLLVVEIRYLFPSLALFMLFKEKDSPGVAFASFLIYVEMSAFVMYFMLIDAYFP